MREARSSLIRSAGLRVSTFASAQDFLAQPQTDAPSRPVLDVQLPGLSGLDLQQELARARVQIPSPFSSPATVIFRHRCVHQVGALEFLTEALP